ncbi:MAG: type II secretion system protein [Planctomycetota bacterium]
MQSPRRRGVTLLEIMVVVAIIAILAVILVPMLRSRIAANETAALGNLRALKTAGMQYYMQYRQGPTRIENLIGGENPFLSMRLENHAGVAGNPGFDRAEGVQGGYRFWFGEDPVTGKKYGEAIPVQDGKTGSRRFRSYSDGILRFAIGRDPLSADSQVQ